MSVKLEKYLNDNRNNLDVEDPDDEVIWEGIKTGLPVRANIDNHKTRKAGFIRIRNIAALIIILFSLGYITSDVIHHNIANRKISLSSIDDRLGSREIEYKTLVRLKTKEVTSFINSDDLVIKELFEEIKELDKIYDQSIADLKELGPDEKVVNIIFKTYEQKIRLLELIILETNKNISHENNEKIIL